MPKFPSESWGVTVIAKDSTRKPICDANGNMVKEKIRMADAQLPNGVPQPLYFPEGHERTGWFKGMAQILVKHSYAGASHLQAECKDFKCPPDRTDCCCCWLMSMVNWILQMSSQSLRQLVIRVDLKWYSCRNFTVSSISLSNAGAFQSGFIEWNHGWVRRRCWNAVWSSQWKLCLWRQCSGEKFSDYLTLVINQSYLDSSPALQSDCLNSWMHILKVLTDDRLLGQ